MIINIPKSDLLKNVPLEKGWYPAKVVSFQSKPSNDGQSINFIYTIEIEKDGRTIDHNFNSKARGMMVPFIAVFDKTVNIDVSKKDDGHNFESDLAVGKNLDVEIYVDNWNGRLLNKISNFAPYNASKEDIPF